MIQKRVNQESLATKAVSEAAEFQLSNEALDFLVDLLMNIDEGGQLPLVFHGSNL